MTFEEKEISMHDENDVYLSIVIPAHNEEKRIGNTLDNIINYLNKKDYKSEIIVVVDGSTDSTMNVIKEFVRKDSRIKATENKITRGKGYSIKKGMLETKGKFALFTDADLSTPISEVEKLIHWLEKGYDVAIGSRSLKDSQVEIHQPFIREFMGKIFNKIMSLLVCKGFKDTQCGFKCFKRPVINKIFSRQIIKGFAFDVEIILIAERHGFRVKEVPVRWLNSPHSKVSIIRDPLIMFCDLLRIKFYDLMKKY